MPEDNWSEHVRYRLEKATDDLRTARFNFDAGNYNVAANRVYYSVFHSMRAIVALERVSFKKHSGVISYFRREYISTGIFDKKFSKLISEASTIRNGSDYDDFYDADKESTGMLIDRAAEFYQAVSDYVFLRIVPTE
jgi:uncharacterized protein (UPF0332 family)